MRKILIDDDVVRLVRAAQRMARLAQDIGERAQQGTALPDHGDQVTVEHVATCPSTERLIQASRDAMAAYRRQPDFDAPAIFRNSTWLLMLELFTADRSGVAVPVKAASLTLGGATSTANRTILDLERLGLIRSVSDETDARRRLLKLTPHADTILQIYLGQQIERSEPSLRMSLKLTPADPQTDQNDAAALINSPMDRTIRGPENTLQW